MNSPIHLSRSGPVATLTLNRPEAGNAIDVEMADAFLEVVLACDADDGVRCVVLTGTSPMFCTGGDVKAFAAAGDQVPALIKRLTALT